MNGKTKKVFVGLSGGVDSSVSAAILRQRGFDVTGVFIKGWYPDWQECSWRDDRRDAMRVCARLGIPFITLDLEKEYKKDVVDYMIREYKAGRTPNPDVMCNKEIKFGEFLKFARKNGAHYIATGHYAQVKKMKDKILLRKGNDSNKDQSYFLWTLSQEQLEHVIFPIGHLNKPDVRKLAKKFGLPTALKKDSQGLCFIGKVDMHEFLSHYIKPRTGNVINKDRKIIGSHNGAAFFTIGQRHGFHIKNKMEKSTPYFVIAKDVRKNIITASNMLEDDIELTFGEGIKLENSNWIGEIPKRESTYKARLRYRQKLVNARVARKKETWVVTLEQSSADVSPGQSLVLYQQENLVGGGVISL